MYAKQPGCLHVARSVQVAASCKACWCWVVVLLLLEVLPAPTFPYYEQTHQSAQSRHFWAAAPHVASVVPAIVYCFR